MRLFLKKTIKSSRITLILSGIFIILLIVYVALWYFDVDKGSVTYWASLCTIAGLLFAIHKQFSLEGRLEVHDKTTVSTCAKICRELTADRLLLLEEKEIDYKSLNLLRRRLQKLLQNCNNYCLKEKQELYSEAASKLAKWKFEITKKSKGERKKFDEKSFTELLNELDALLVMEEQRFEKM